MELPREVAACQRRQDANFQSTSQQARASGAHLRTFNILTYKLHVLGDYAASIRLFGTTDSYTTQIVRVSCSATLTIFILTLCVLQGELAHRLIKMLYRSTNKQDTSKQLAKGTLTSDGSSHPSRQASLTTYALVTYHLKPIIFCLAIDPTS
jgi:hypothetical protein